MKDNSRPLLALGAIIISIAAPAAYRIYLDRSAPDAEIVIPAGSQPATSSPSPKSAILPGVQAANASEAPATPASAEIVVHVAGAVKSSGIYRFKPGERCFDAVKAAGGATPDANLDGINLAAKLEDGQQLYVPKKGEEGLGAGAGAGAVTGARAGGSRNGKSAAAKPAKLQRGQGTVNLNAATKEQLMTLPGIGESYAQRILDYRKTNGGFKELEQLMDVSGIGEKKLEKLRPFVRLK